MFQTRTILVDLGTLYQKFNVSNDSQSKHEKAFRIN